MTNHLNHIKKAVEENAPRINRSILRTSQSLMNVDHLISFDFISLPSSKFRATGNRSCQLCVTLSCASWMDGTSALRGLRCKTLKKDFFLLSSLKPNSPPGKERPVQSRVCHGGRQLLRADALAARQPSGQFFYKLTRLRLVVKIVK